MGSVSNEKSMKNDVTSMFASAYGRSTRLSSATTATTFGPTSAQKERSGFSTRSSVTRKGKRFAKDLDSATATTATASVIGVKRRAPIDTACLEIGSQLSSMPSQKITLKDTSTGLTKEFSIFDEEGLKKFHQNSKVSNFDMSTLEAEYDYTTDSEQVHNACRNLTSELFLAVEFFVKDDPLVLFENAIV